MSFLCSFKTRACRVPCMITSITSLSQLPLILLILFSSLFTSSLFLKHYQEVAFLLRFLQLFILPENSPTDILKAKSSLPSDLTQSYLTGESNLLLTLHIPLPSSIFVVVNLLSNIFLLSASSI